MKPSFVQIALLGLVALALPARASLLIDDFTTFQTVSQNCATIGTPVGASVAGGGILGGERDVMVNITSCPGAGDLAVVVTSYFHSADAGVRGISLAAWDGNDGDGLVVNPVGLGGVDLTEGGAQDALEVLVQQADLNSTLVFEVFTDAGNSSTYTLNLVGGALNSDFVIPYAGFVTNLGSGADFSNVGAITMLIDGTAVSSLDVIVDLLQTTSTLTAAKTGALFIDGDNDGLIESGETVRYTVTISNPDDDNDATSPSVLFSDTPDANTNLVVGSVTTTQGTVTLGNTGGDTSVEVNVGNVADGVSVTITFDVVVKSGTTAPICNQGFVTHASALFIGDTISLPTDDSNTPAPDDPTCLPVAYCGDGQFDPTDEQCDDGNTDNTDGCTNTCQLPICGDGFTQPGIGEQCDDANMDNTDGCTNACQLPICGDGFTQPGIGEQCDDANMDNTDGCTNACQLPICGDGFTQPGIGEQCDDANMDNTDGCTNACQLPICGDGFVQPGNGEQCDDGNANDNDDCSNNCTQGCGNGIVNTGEPCDDGNQINDDGCTNNCALPACGDGILQAGEQCDDHNNVAGDGCSPTCNTEFCGNGILDPGEVCDGAADQACPPDAQCLPDCTCQSTGTGGEIPTVSQWGLTILALLLLTGAKLRFSRRRTA